MSSSGDEHRQQCCHRECRWPARCRRRFWRDDRLILHVAREGSQAQREFGTFYLTDERNCIDCTHQDLEKMAQELGVLRSNEAIHLAG